MGKILVAEDDFLTQKLPEMIINKMGHSVFISPNGRHAYERLRSKLDINLLITDIMMPEMDGRQLIQALRMDTAFQCLPIIVISAVVGYTDILNLLELGATRFQAKPLDRDELRKNITECLKDHDFITQKGTPSVLMQKERLKADKQY